MHKKLHNNYKKYHCLSNKDMIDYSYHKNFTSEFKAILKEKGIGVNELANKINELSDDGDGGKIDSLIKYKNGKRTPRQDKLKMIAKALDVTIYELGYPKSALETVDDLNKNFPEDDREEYYDADDSYEFEDKCHRSFCLREIMERLQGVNTDIHTAISLFPATYLSIDADFLELLLLFQSFNENDKQYLNQCVSVLLESQPIEKEIDIKSKPYKQVLQFMQNEDFTDTEKYNLDKTEDNIWEFIKKCGSDDCSKLKENIKIYALLDDACFKLLIRLMTLDREIKQQMILRIADQMYRVNADQMYIVNSEQ